MKYVIVIDKTASGYSSWSPDLPGCVATGDSSESTQKTMQEAIQFHIDGMREEGMEIPQPSGMLAYVEVAD